LDEGRRLALTEQRIFEPYWNCQRSASTPALRLTTALTSGPLEAIDEQAAAALALLRGLGRAAVADHLQRVALFEAEPGHERVVAHVAHDFGRRGVVVDELRARALELHAQLLRVRHVSALEDAHRLVLPDAALAPGRGRFGPGLGGGAAVAFGRNPIG